VVFHEQMQPALDLDACYRRYGPLVYRRCLRLLRSEAQAEEALQDVFVELVRHRERIEDRGLSSLLFRMATNVSLNRLRTRGRRPEHRDEQLLLSIALDEELEARSLAERVLQQLFGREPPSTRVMATMHYVDGMTIEEVAAEFEMSVSGVRKRLRTLRARLQKLMEDGHGRAA
jgi:RNA polymerase sigma factor (sigma-70 family)